MDLLSLVLAVPLLALIVGAAGFAGLAISLVLVQVARSASPDVLDREARGRVLDRLDAIRGSAGDDLAMLRANAVDGALLGPRRRLWRDTSVLLLVIAGVLLAMLALNGGTQPRGGVLGITASALPSPLTAEVGAVPSDGTVPSRSPAPSGSPVPSPWPSSSPSPTPAPTRRPVPSPSSSGGPGPSAARLAVLSRCADRPDCYVYVVRRGDNLTSIANWFGVPFDTMVALNPHLREHGLRPGDRITLPTPTR